VTYRYDSSLSPELNWDGQNHTRETGEALIREILEAKSLEDAKHAAERLKAMRADRFSIGQARRSGFRSTYRRCRCSFTSGYQPKASSRRSRATNSTRSSG
jgi:hypothetical protein